MTYGSGNVFADLGFEDAEEMLAKAKLVVAIKDIIKERKLNQTQAAKLMGIDQPRVSKLMHSRLQASLRTDSLMQYLLHLGFRSWKSSFINQPVPPKREGAISVAYQ